MTVLVSFSRFHGHRYLFQARSRCIPELSANLCSSLRKVLWITCPTDDGMSFKNDHDQCSGHWSVSGVSRFSRSVTRIPSPDRSISRNMESIGTCNLLFETIFTEVNMTIVNYVKRVDRAKPPSNAKDQENNLGVLCVLSEAGVRKKLLPLASVDWIDDFFEPE